MSRLLDLIPGHRARADASLDNPRVWSSWGPWSSRKTVSGADVDSNKALTLSVYFACLRNISEDVGKTPLCVYEELERGRRKARDHAQYHLLQRRPNPEMSGFAFRSLLVYRAMSWGNGRAWIQRDGSGEAIAYWPIHPSRVVLKRVEGRLIYIVRLDDTPAAESTRGKPIGIWPEDMIDVVGHLSEDGLNGQSLVAVAAEAIGLGMAAQDFAAAMFGNDLTFGSFIVHPETLSDDAHRHLMSSMNEDFQGSKKAFKNKVLEEGVRIERAGIPPREAQMIESRVFSVVEFARFARMPLHMVQDLERGTFSNIEHLRIEYVQDTLLAWFERIEQEVDCKGLGFDSGFYAEHNVDALQRGDFQTRMTGYKTAVSGGWLSPNDVRAKENENPIEGPEGDAYYMQGAMVPLALLFAGKNLATARTTPAAGGEYGEEKPDDEKTDPAKAAAPAPAPAPAARKPVAGEVTRFAPIFRAALERTSTKARKAMAEAMRRFEGDVPAYRLWNRRVVGDLTDHLRSGIVDVAVALHAGVEGKDEASPAARVAAAVWAKQEAEFQIRALLQAGITAFVEGPKETTAFLGRLENGDVLVDEVARAMASRCYDGTTLKAPTGEKT